MAQGYYELRVDLEDWEGNQRFAQYNVFDIGNFAEDYRLSVGVYSGNAGLLNSEVAYKLLFGCIYSILSNTITGGGRGTTDDVAKFPFHLDLFSAALVNHRGAPCSSG